MIIYKLIVFNVENYIFYMKATCTYVSKGILLKYLNKFRLYFFDL